MKINQITYGRTKSCDFNNEKVEIVVEIKEDENPEEILKNAKSFVAKQLGEEIEDTYHVGVVCDNCKTVYAYGNYIEIPKGRGINEVRCPYCGSFGTLRNSYND